MTYAECIAHRDAWIAADLAVSQGQSYMITVGGAQRTLNRVDAAEIRKAIDYWETKAAQAARGSRAPRVRLVVPRD